MSSQNESVTSEQDLRESLEKFMADINSLKSFDTSILQQHSSTLDVLFKRKSGSNEGFKRVRIAVLQHQKMLRHEHIQLVEILRRTYLSFMDLGKTSGAWVPPEFDAEFNKRSVTIQPSPPPSPIRTAANIRRQSSPDPLIGEANDFAAALDRLEQESSVDTIPSGGGRVPESTEATFTPSPSSPLSPLPFTFRRPSPPAHNRVPSSIALGKRKAIENIRIEPVSRLRLSTTLTPGPVLQPTVEQTTSTPEPGQASTGPSTNQARVQQVQLPDSVRSISFDEVFQGGFPDYEIEEFPARSGQRYILSCKQHSFECGRDWNPNKFTQEPIRRGSLRSAGAHIRKAHVDTGAFFNAVHLMGTLVCDCTQQQAELNNAAFHELVIRNRFKPRRPDSARRAPMRATRTKTKTKTAQSSASVSTSASTSSSASPLVPASVPVSEPDTATAQAPPGRRQLETIEEEGNLPTVQTEPIVIEDDAENEDITMSRSPPTDDMQVTENTNTVTNSANQANGVQAVAAADTNDTNEYSSLFVEDEDSDDDLPDISTLMSSPASVRRTNAPENNRQIQPIPLSLPTRDITTEANGSEANTAYSAPNTSNHPIRAVNANFSIPFANMNGTPSPAPSQQQRAPTVSTTSRPGNGSGHTAKRTHSKIVTVRIGKSGAAKKATPAAKSAGPPRSPGAKGVFSRVRS